MQEGANPDFEEPPNKSTRPHQLRTTLSRAVGYGHRDMIEFLLDSGARLPEDRTQQAKLSYSARCADSPESLLLLLRRGLLASRNDADWALKNGHADIYKFAVEQLGEYKIAYDIDALLGKKIHTFYNEFSQAVPAHGSIHEHMLLPEERVIRDLWELTCSTGCGFTSLINNEGYDTVERSFAALSALGDSLALKALVELKAVLAGFGFPAEPALAVRHVSTIVEDQWKALNEELEGLDTQYFHSANDSSLWRSPDYLQQGREYARNGIGTLRQRNIKG